MDNPFISIIIPVYQVEQFLPLCLDSILSQNCDKWECILVDDGSPDKSGLICDEYAKKDSRFKVIHKVNGGVSSARNVGLQIAQAEIISFADSDDWITSDYCKKIIEQMDDDTDLLFFQSRHHFPDMCIQTHIPRCGTYVERNDIEEELTHLLVNDIKYEFFGYTWNKAFRRSIFRKTNIQFMCNLSFKEDELFTLQYATGVKKMKVIPDVLYEYRVISSGLTHKEKQASELYKLFEAEEALIPVYNNPIFHDCIQSRNINFLFGSCMGEKGFVKTLRRFYDVRKYYKTHHDIKPRRIIKMLCDKTALISYLLCLAYKIIKG